MLHRDVEAIFEHLHDQIALRFGDPSDAKIGAKALAWLADRTNTFINVLRPAIRSAVADIEEVDG